MPGCREDRYVPILGGRGVWQNSDGGSSDKDGTCSMGLRWAVHELASDFGRRLGDDHPAPRAVDG